jgi:hypothetical protein
MGRNAAVPTGTVRLTDDEVAWLAGDESKKPRLIVRAIAVALLCLYRHGLENGPEMYQRALVVQLASSLPMNGINVPQGRAARTLAENAIRTAVAHGYIDRVWNAENGVWRYRLDELGLEISEQAWGEQGRAYLAAKEQEEARAKLLEELVPKKEEEPPTDGETVVTNSEEEPHA